MSDQGTREAKLSRQRVLDAAMSLADREGIEALTMRALATALGAKPMSLYHWVAGKDALLGEMVEAVFAEMEKPRDDLSWREAIRRRCLSAREVLVRHPWAVPLLESGTTPGPLALSHHEAVLAKLDRGGMPLSLMAHAYAILDSFIYGFAVQEANLPVQVQGGDKGVELAAEISSAFDPVLYPTLIRLTIEHVMKPGYSFGASFEYGLDLLLDGLERAVD